MPRLRIKNGPSSGATFEVRDEPLVMGREPTCQIQILDKGASRSHSEVFRIGEMCFIRDLNSRNGSLLNDAPIEEELLREGDRIQIGATILIFENQDADAPAESNVEFSEDELGNTLEMRLEDLSVMNVGEGDAADSKRLRTLYRLGRMLVEHHEEKKLIEEVLPFIAEQLNADCAYLFMRDAQKGSITPLGTYRKKEGRGGKVSRTIIRRSIQEKRALLTSDAMQDNRFSARDSIVMKQIHSVICVPLSVSGDFSGVMYIATDNPTNTFAEEELELAIAIADYVGLALSHLRTQATERANLMGAISVLLRVLDDIDPATEGRSRRIANYCKAIGLELKMPPKQLVDLEVAALLHNVGSLISGDENSLEAGTQAPEKERIVSASLDLITNLPGSAALDSTIRYQNESIDGSGANGLKAEAIPLPARILAVAKAFDAKANRLESASADALKTEAVVELGRQAGRTLDENVVKALLVAYRNNRLVTTDSPAEAKPPKAGISGAKAK